MDDVPPLLPSNPVKFLDQLLAFIRQQNKAWATEKTYLLWIRRFIRFHHLKHPAKMGETEIESFLNHLALERHCTPSTQSTALNALIFLYKQFLKHELSDLAYHHAKKQRRLPVVFSEKEARSVIAQLSGEQHLIAKLMYGAGLRVSECLRLRVKDIDFERNEITVRAGKGNKDRITMLPEASVEELHYQIKHVAFIHDGDMAAGFGEVYMPYALARKYPQEAKSLGWQFLFPSQQRSTDPRDQQTKRHHRPQRIYKEPSKKLFLKQVYTNMPTAIPFVIPLLLTC